MGKKVLLGDLDFEEFHNFLNSRVFLVHDMLLVDKENYKMYFKKFYNYLKQGFEKEEVRTYPVKFKFTDNPAEPVKILQLRHMIVNMIFWRVFLKLDKVGDLNSCHIIDCTNPVTPKVIKYYFDTYVIDPYQKLVSNRKMNRVAAKMIYDYSKISQDFGTIMAITINTESFIHLAERNPRFNEMIRHQLEPGLQPKEIEEYQHNLMVEMIDIMSHDKEFCLQPILMSGSGIKDKQLVEFAGVGGLKPDVNGNTIPIPITNNFLINGLNTVRNYYVDAQSGRKSVILNKTSMGTSGFFAAKCMMAASTITLSKSFREEMLTRTNHHERHHIHACNTVRPIVFEVKDDKYLKKIHRRFYYLDLNNFADMRCVNYKTDKWLIGKTIYLRSPITCTCDDGICEACYGDLAYTNSELNFNIGAYASAKLNNTLEQNILSTKHLLTTSSDELIFPEEFNKLFILDANKIKVNQDTEENTEDWTIRIYLDDMFEFNAKEENDFNTSIDKFYIINKKTGKEYEIKDLNKGQSMFIYADVLDMFKKAKDEDYIEMGVDKIDDGETYFVIIVIENNELTRPLKNIMRLLDRKDHFDCNNIDELVNKMCDLLIEANHPLDLVHAECIMRAIVRDKDHILSQPHFEDPDQINDYQIITISKCLLNNPSLTVSLSYQDLGKQITNVNTNKKCEKSAYDDLYCQSLR